MIARAGWLTLVLASCGSFAGGGCAQRRTQLGASALGPQLVEVTLQGHAGPDKRMLVDASHGNETGAEADASFERVAQTEAGKEVWAGDTGLLSGAWAFYGLSNGFNDVTFSDHTLEHSVRCVAR